MLKLIFNFIVTYKMQENYVTTILLKVLTVLTKKENATNAILLDCPVEDAKRTISGLDPWNFLRNAIKWT